MSGARIDAAAVHDDQRELREAVERLRGRVALLGCLASRDKRLTPVVDDAGRLLERADSLLDRSTPRAHRLATVADIVRRAVIDIDKQLANLTTTQEDTAR